MKPGVKSTEFGSVVAMVLLAALNKKLGLEISDEMLMTLAALVGGYIAQRGWVKSKVAAEPVVE